MINHVCCIPKPRQKTTPSLSTSMGETAIKCTEIINDDCLAQETKRLLMDDFHKQNNLPTHVDMYDPDTHCKRIIKSKALYMAFCKVLGPFLVYFALRGNLVKMHIAILLYNFVLGYV